MEDETDIAVPVHDNPEKKAVILRGPGGRFAPGTAKHASWTPETAPARQGGLARAEAVAKRARKEAAEITTELVGQGLVGSVTMQSLVQSGAGLSAAQAAAVVAGAMQRAALENASEKPREAAVAAKLALQMQQLAPAEAETQRAVVAVQINITPELVEWVEGSE